MKRSFATKILIALIFSMAFAASASDLVREKHIIPAPAPYGQPKGVVTPDGTFNVRDKNEPFYSDKLADAFMLDQNGKLASGKYLDFNHAIYTSYRLSSDSGTPNTILILMPGTWAGAMSLNQYAVDLLRLAKDSGVKGFQVWLIDRRSEQLEDHTGILWANQNLSKMPVNEILQGLSDYYRPFFKDDGQNKMLMNRKLTPLDHNAVRFIANWGGDTTIRDWRVVVLAAAKAVGDEVIEKPGEEPVIVKKPGKKILIGGHSLGGSLTVLYAAYDFDRRPNKEILGANDVDGLVLLEGGGFPNKPASTIDADSYLNSQKKRFTTGKVYFDMNMLGIQYAPSTMLSLDLSGWAADNARGQESVFPQYARPKQVQLPHITNEAMLGFAIDDDLATFFIARTSIGYPTGALGKQFKKASGIPFDPGKCPIITPFGTGHKPLDENFVYGWINIDQKPKSFFYGKSGCKRCTAEGDQGPEVTDIYSFARMVYNGVDYYAESPDFNPGPNDFAEWYFPPRLSSDSMKLGSRIVEKDGTELFSGVHVQDISLPVISFFGGDSMGNFRVPKLSGKYFPAGVLKHKETQVHLNRGYTHLDITAATRNNQPDLKNGFENYNASAVYSYRFISSIAGWK